MKRIKRYMPAGIASFMIVMAFLALGTNADELKSPENIKGTCFSEERHAQMEEVLASRDYQTFVNAISQDHRGGRILEFVTEETFPKFLEMHDLIEEGDIDGAEAIAEELGLPRGMMGKRGFGNGEHNGKRGNEAVQTALDSSDYNAFVDAVSKDGRGSKILELLTEANFPRFIEMHKLMEAGNFQEARVIGDELGLPAFDKENSMKKWKKSSQEGKRFKGKFHNAQNEA